MPNKKVIFAIVLFVVSGLLVYSFASPDNEPTPNDDKKPVVEENENNDKNQNDNDDNTSGDVVVGDTDTNNDTTDNVNVTPVVVVPVNYDSLETAVNNSEEIINSEIVEDYLVDLLEELGDVTEEAKTILEARNATQETVDNQTNVINGLINQINNIVDNKLKESRSSGETLLVSNTGDDEKPKNAALNNLLNQLKNNIEDEEIESKPLPQRLNYINNVNRLINDVETLQTELNIIEQAQITLTPSTSSWTNKDVILSLNIDIEDESLIESKQFFKNDEEIEENNNSAIADENATYKVLVNFTNGESKYSNEVVVNNIDREAPIANLRIEYSSIDGNIYGKNIVVIGEVDASEKNIKSHWFEITNPDKSSSYVHNLNTNDLTYSFNLDTTKGSGTYIIRYVATDIAGNRSDDPGFSNPTVVTVIVDSTDPQTTINVSEVYQGKFIVSGVATDNYKLNRVYVQLISRETRERCGGTTINLLKPEQTTANWSLQYDVNDLGENCPDGYYAAHASVVDDLGNSGDTGWTENFLVDGTAPDIVLDESNDVSVEYNSTYNNFGYSATDNIDGDLTDKVEVEIRFQEQGGKWEDREFYSDKLGLYEIYYRVTDSQGNETKIFRKVEIVDTKKPEVKVNLNRQSYINSGDIISTRDIPEYEARDENLEKIIIYKENGEVKNTIIVENRIKRLGKMTHLNNGKYYIVAYDKAGNESEPFYFTIDNTAPTVTMSSITDNSYINTNNVKINIKAEDNIGLSKLVINLYKKKKDESFLFESYSAILNGVLEYNCEHDFSYLDLEDGSYYVKINAKDKTGKTSNTIVRNFVIDTEAPVLAVESEGNYEYDYENSKYVERGATANDAIDGEVEVKIEGTVNDKVAGIHTITYTAVDKAGNEAKYERTIVIRPLVIAPDDFTHEVGNEFVAPKGTVIISENDKFEIDPNNYSWNPNQLGEYELEYQYVLKIGDREISSPGKKTKVTVVDTTNPDVTYGKPEITKNYKESCLFGICNNILTNVDVNVNVNVEDNGEIVELKYIWLPSWRIIDNVVWKTEKLWDKAHDFENNSVITKNFKKLELLSNWKLWVYAKDASGNVQISSSEKIELVNL